MTDRAKANGLHVPESFSQGTRKDFARLHEFILRQKPSVFESHYAEMAKHADVFVSCWNSDYPTLAMKWLRSQEEVLAETMCGETAA